MTVPIYQPQGGNQQNQVPNLNTLNQLGVRYRAPKAPQQEQGNLGQSDQQQRNEDAIVCNLIAHNYTGVLTCAYCVRLRGQALTYSSLLREIAISGHHINRGSSADRAVLLLQNGRAGVVQCAFQLLSRGIPVCVNTLYEELWVTGRL